MLVLRDHVPLPHEEHEAHQIQAGLEPPRQLVITRAVEYALAAVHTLDLGTTAWPYHCDRGVIWVGPLDHSRVFRLNDQAIPKTAWTEAHLARF